MNHAKLWHSVAHKIATLLLVLAFVFILPVEAQNDVVENTVRVQQFPELGYVTYDFLGVTHQRTITDIEVMREWIIQLGLEDSDEFSWLWVDWMLDGWGAGYTIIYANAPATVAIESTSAFRLPIGFGYNADRNEIMRYVMPRAGACGWGWDDGYGGYMGGCYPHAVNPLGLCTWSDHFYGYLRFDNAGFFPFFVMDVEFAHTNIILIVEDATQQYITPPTYSIPIYATPDLATANTWAHEGITSAVTLGLVPQTLQNNFTNNTTRAEFATLAVTLYETVTGREITARTAFNDTTDINVQKMGGLGVITGVGDGYFAPNRTINRQEAAVMLARLAYVIGQPIAPSAPTFADNDYISSWAIDSVGQMQDAGIMGGVSYNNFDPSGTFTREQSILALLRLFELLYNN